MSAEKPLAQQSCVACRRGEPTLTQPEIEALLPRLPEWRVVVESNIPRLHRSFRFDDFVQALAFTHKVGELAEAEGHHPAIYTEWGRVRVEWWSHKIEGLHKNDFVMAAKADALYAG